jgi:hypothetical protein
MVKPPLRTKSIGFKVSEEEYAQLETAAQADGRTLGEPPPRSFVIPRTPRRSCPHAGWCLSRSVLFHWQFHFV